MQNTEDTLKRYLAGDSLAFSEIYDAYFSKLYNFVFYKVGNREDSEEIVSETFLRAVKGLKKYDASKGAFSTWIYTIARNCVCDHFRKKYEVEDIEDHFELKSNEDVERKVAASLELQKVEEYLKKLTAAQREIVMLRVWEGMSYKEIGEVVGKKETAVKTAFGRVIKQIQGEMILLYLIFLITQ